MIELEIFLIFWTSIFFTLLYIVSKEPFFGILTFGGWFSLGMAWLLITPMSTAYAFAFFFQAIGVLFLLAVIIQYLHNADVKKGYGEEESD